MPEVSGEDTTLIFFIFLDDSVGSISWQKISKIFLRMMFEISIKPFYGIRFTDSRPSGENLTLWRKICIDVEQFAHRWTGVWILLSIQYIHNALQKNRDVVIVKTDLLFNLVQSVQSEACTIKQEFRLYTSVFLSYQKISGFVLRTWFYAHLHPHLLTVWAITKLPMQNKYVCMLYISRSILL